MENIDKNIITNNKSNFDILPSKKTNEMDLK